MIDAKAQWAVLWTNGQRTLFRTRQEAIESLVRSSGMGVAAYQAAASSFG